MNKLILAVLAGALCAAALPSVSAAQAYPDKPIRVIVPYPPGDLADIIARLIGPKITEQLGQPVVVENRPGASGMVGLQNATQAPPDGYTLVLGQMGSMAVAPIINKQPFDVRDAFVPVAMAYTNYLMLVSHPDFPAKTLPDLIAYSKANPGKVSLATNGEGGFPHLAVELLKRQTGFSFTHIPYKGSNQSVTDVIGGQVPLTISGASSMNPHVKAGRLHGIAITARERSRITPDVPTFKEAVPDYEALGWFGFFAPKGTPDAIISKLNNSVNAALKMPDVAQKAATLELDTSPGSPQYFGVVWRRDYDKWGSIIRDLKLDTPKP